MPSSVRLSALFFLSVLGVIGAGCNTTDNPDGSCTMSDPSCKRTAGIDGAASGLDGSGTRTDGGLPVGCGSVDLSKDPFNCGKCGTVCAQGGSCTAGACGCPQTCAGGRPCTCTQLSACCNQILNGPENQRCNNTLSTGSDTACAAALCGYEAEIYCNRGSTLCGAPMPVCNGVCTSVVEDRSNCGGCGVKCAMGASCVNGGCACPNGGMSCSGVCVTSQSDPMNCGGCGLVCGGMCTLGRCLVRLSSMQAASIALDGVNVYWTAFSSSGFVMKVPIGGGNPVMLAGGLTYPFGIAVDGMNVYWTNSNGGFGGTAGSVMKVPLGGGSPVTLASGLGYPTAIAVDGTNAYWVDAFWSKGVSGGGGNVMKVALGGGTAGTLQPYYGNSLRNLMVVAPTGIYVAVGGGVLRMPLAGGNPTQVGPSPAAGIAVDATNLYWTDAAAGTLMKISLTAGGMPTVLASNLMYPLGVAVDATSVYCTTQKDGTVVKVPIAGGAPTTLASGRGNPTVVAVDATSVYWSDDGGGGGLMMVTPK